MDQHLFFLINQTWTCPFLDRLMAAVSSWDFWWPFFLLLILGVLLFGGFRARAAALAIGLSLAVTDGVVVKTLKEIIARPRPPEVLQGTRTVDLARAKPRFLALGEPLRVKYPTPNSHSAHGNSFPSAHTANNFAAATVIVLFYRRWGWLAFLPALLVSYSRIYVGSHWPSDVVVSCIIGVGIALIVVGILRILWRKLGIRWLPKIAAAHPELLAE